MIRAAIVTLAILTGSAAVAQQPVSSSCGWLVFADVTKANAVERSCRYAIQAAGYDKSPKSTEWFSRCGAIVNAAIASCSDTDNACVKEGLKPLYPQICNIEKQIGPK
jgi:hypothetical protein